MARHSHDHSLYFSAFTEEAGRELYRLDPWSHEPTLIDLSPGGGYGSPHGFTELGGQLYFANATLDQGTELVRYSPRTGATTVFDINAGAAPSDPYQLTPFAGALYFGATTEENGTELYRLARGSDTPTLIDINPTDAQPGPEATGSVPTDFFEFGGQLYFRAFSEANGNELYRLDPGSTTSARWAVSVSISSCTTRKSRLSKLVAQLGRSDAGSAPII